MLRSLNVLGTPLGPCSHKPLTGWFRDGCCNTDASDRGSHTVCARVTEPFLEFLALSGNNLKITEKQRICLTCARTNSRESQRRRRALKKEQAA